jgi:hypothetical protein
MKRIIAFRFHNNFEVCENRLRILKSLNQDIPIFGLFGGERSDFYFSRERLGEYCEDIYEIPETSKDWKWKNGDISLCNWYRSRGKSVQFDMLHLLEWDLLVLKNLDDTYAHVNKGEIGLTALTPLAKIENEWWWTSSWQNRREWHKLVSIVESRFGPVNPKYACQGPANCFSREFLEFYSREKIPELVHEELRWPLYAAAFGISIANNQAIYREIFHKPDMRFFNCEGFKISREVIQDQLSLPNGRRVFHPYQGVLEMPSEVSASLVCP